MPDAQGNPLVGEPGYVAPVPTTGIINTAPAPTAASAPVGAVASTSTAAPFTVAPNQTVASNIAGIVAADSPLLQQAAARAAARMNDRGLLNSSQAISAGQSAVYDAALPIASADAATYDRAAANTVNAQNTARLQNANMQTGINQSNAAGVNAQILQQIQSGTQMSLADKNTALQTYLGQLQSNTTMSVADKSAASQKVIAGIQASTSLTLADKNAMLQTTLQNIQGNQQLTLQDRQSQTQTLLTQMDINSRAALQAAQNSTTLTVADKQAAQAQYNADLAARTQISIQQIDNAFKTVYQTADTAAKAALAAAENATKTGLANIQANYQSLMQVSASATSMFQSGMGMIAAVIGDSSIPADAKANAIGGYLSWIEEGMMVIGNVNAIDLSQILDFSRVTA
ncbi:MAG: hypothetical protein Q8R92_16990 [Deltaproteobacteria bacterium]|nr:hypothetical protein [Deltaproteobacteria bacterium]